jgi:hypothetical protein
MPSLRSAHADARATASHGLIAEDVADHDRGERKPDPEHDEDDGDDQIGLRRALLAGEPGVDHDHEQRDADRARQRCEQARDPQDGAFTRFLKPRGRPERRERDEGDDEHDACRPREQPLRDRQILLADQPMREAARGHRGGAQQPDHRQAAGQPQPAHGSTITLASVCLCSSSSTMNWPSIVAGKSKRTLPFSATSLCTS